MTCKEAMEKYPRGENGPTWWTDLWAAVQAGAKAEEERDAIVNECFGMRQNIEAGMDERRVLTAENERLKAELDHAKAAISDDDHWAQGALALVDENSHQRAVIAAQHARIEKLEVALKTAVGHLRGIDANESQRVADEADVKTKI